jgi:hypothetical protein
MKKIMTLCFIAFAVLIVNAQDKTAKKTKPATPAPAAKTTVAPAAATNDHSGHDHSGHDHAAHSQETPAQAPAVNNNPNAAKIIFKEEKHNFGEIPEGPAVTTEFKFTNTGKEPLILSNVRASCGCTTPSWPKEPILPGKDGTIVVTYNTQGRPGNFTKTVTVTSNASEPNKVITINGEVIKEEPNKSVPVEQPSMLSPKN